MIGIAKTAAEMEAGKVDAYPYEMGMDYMGNDNVYIGDKVYKCKPEFAADCPWMEPDQDFDNEIW